MTEIRELDERTVERIAAGEVAERPASVVKELVENSVDADADRIAVTVREGGIEGIRVTDDGVGMDREAVRRAIRQHTTSKISDIADLEAGVGTLGFRGEALHAIGAVSRLTIRTRPREGGAGTELRVEGGEVVDVSPVGCPAGTTVEVEDLFYNVPARRKYLAETTTEFGHVNLVVTSYALANPDVAVSLTHGDRETFATAGQGDLREAILSVYGREVARAMLPVGAGDSPAGVGLDDPPDEGLSDGPLAGVAGLVSHPETNRAGREYCTVFVNGRYVRSSAVREAVVDAYGTQLAPDRYPFAVLFLNVPPGDVDVNVHPRKLEVRFADEAGLREQVRGTVESALLREGLVRSSAPRGQSAPEQTEIAPERGDAGSGATGDPGTASQSGDHERGGGDHERGEGDHERGEGDHERGEGDHERGGGDHERGGSDHVHDGAADSGGAERERRPADAHDVADAAHTDTRESGPSAATPDEGRAGTDAPADERADGTAPAPGAGTADHGAGERARSFTLADAGEQARLGGEVPDAEYDSLPDLRLLGQYRDTYVVAETPDGLALIDQHAADERVNYERLQAAFEGTVTTQALARPVEIEVTAGEAATFERRREALARLGFQASLVEGDGRALRVRTVPSLLAEPAEPDLLRDVLGAFAAGGDGADTVEAAAEELLADLACYPSITGNTSLAEGSIRDLLAALDDCENPYACPHGRPVIVELDDEELAARFERDYPGHQGRRE